MNLNQILPRLSLYSGQFLILVATTKENGSLITKHLRFEEQKGCVSSSCLELPILSSFLIVEDRQCAGNQNQ